VKIEEIHSDSEDEGKKGPAEEEEEQQQFLRERQALKCLREGVQIACKAKEQEQIVEDAFR
jgi:hypothetical protein